MEKNKNQDRAKITLEEKLELGISKDSRDGFQKEDDQFSSGFSIIM